MPLLVHKGQRQVLNDNHRFKSVCAGRRWGKSRLSLLEILKAIIYPRNLIWYVAPTYGMARSILWDELKDSIPRRLIKSINETRMSILLHNKTRIELKGADKPDTLRGVGLRLVIVDEAQDIAPDTWYKVLYATLTSTGGKAIIIGTPKGFNWFYDVWLLGQRGDTYRGKDGLLRRNSYKSWVFMTKDSPFIPPHEIEQARENLDEKSFRQEFEASFENMAGRVYYNFDRRTHTGDFKFNPHLPIWIGQDFNVDPMSSVIMQPQPNGEVWVVDEIVLRSSNTQETADEVQRRYWKYVSQVTFFPDPAGANRSSARGESDLQILKEVGFRRLLYPKKHPLVADRVNSVNRMLSSADGQIRLRVDSRCKNLIEALEQTIYKEGTREVDKSLGVEHPADALGYAIHYKHPSRRVVVGGVVI